MNSTPSSNARIALRWIGRDGTTRDFSYAALTANANRFANLLAGLGEGRIDYDARDRAVPLERDRTLAIATALAAAVDPNTGKDFVAGKAVKNIRIDGDDVSFDVELGYPAKGSQADLAASQAAVGTGWAVFLGMMPYLVKLGAIAGLSSVMVVMMLRLRSLFPRDFHRYVRTELPA